MKILVDFWLMIDVHESETIKKNLIYCFTVFSQIKWNYGVISTKISGATRGAKGASALLPKSLRKFNPKIEAFKHVFDLTCT